jgi:cell division protein FtsB
MPDEEHNQENIQKKRSTGFYYSFLTLVLLFCLIQIGFGAILNISKTIAYHAKISTLTKIRDMAEAHNQDLKQDIKMFSATSSLEGIARNNLKMAGEDEVLVLINQPQNNVTKNKKKKKSKKKHAGNS